MKNVFMIAVRFIGEVLYLHEDGLDFSTVFATGLFTEVGVEDLVGWDPGKGHTPLFSQHPDDHIWHAALRLMETQNIHLISFNFPPRSFCVT